MAAATILTKPTLVMVIHHVATATGTIHISRRVTLVAGCASYILVSLTEIKACVPFMVENPQRPTVGAMASFAALAHTALMGILIYMASRTNSLCFVKTKPGVTSLALSYGMHAFQRK